MLHIYFGGIIVDDKDIIPNLMEYPDMYFNNQIKKGCITSTLAKEMIYDVDKSEVKGDNCIYSPVLGMIPPTKLSGEVKALLVMLNDKGSGGSLQCICVWRQLFKMDTENSRDKRHRD